MNKWIPAKKDLFLWCVILMGFSLVYSRFMISVCMFAWMIMAFFSWSYQRQRPVIADPVFSLKRRLLHPSNKAYLVLVGFFVIPLIFGLHSSQQSEFFERLRIKLPYLGLPLAFILLPRLGRRAWRMLLIAMNIALISSAVYVLFQYAMKFELINEQLEQGIPMPTPVNHTRYSLLIALIVLFNLSALYIKRHRVGQMLFWMGNAATLFLIIFLHILSVRSGLAVFYIGSAWLIISYAWTNRSVFLGLGLLTAIVLLPVIAYQVSPSFQSRIDYMRYDLEKFLKGEGRHYSDSERIYSLQAGWSVFKRHPWVGVGTGDLRSAVKEAYKTQGRDLEKLPHNQFVTVLASNGILGILLFLFCLFKPFLDNKRYQSIYFSGFFIVLFLSFMVENTIENSVGVAFHMSFMLLLLHREQSQSDDTLPDEVV